MNEWLRVAACFSVAAAAAAGALVSQSSCQLKNCVGVRTWFDGVTELSTAADVHVAPPPHAGAVDATTWQTGSVDDPWVEFGPQEVDFFFPNNGAPFPGPYVNVITYVSANQDANAQGSNWTIATGNLAEVTLGAPDPNGIPAWWVAVHNDTCSPSYVRVVVQRAEPPADAGAPSPSDASSDAPIDDASDASVE